MIAFIALVALSYLLLLLGTGPWGINADNNALLGTFTNRTINWHLYTNNHTPASSDTVSNYTELTNSGYALQQTSGSGWTTTSQTTYYQSTHANLTFTFTGTATVYGYYVTDASNNFWGGELFSGGPFTFGSGSNALILSPLITCGP